MKALIIFSVVGFLLMTIPANNLPRGLRNNNPLNIRWDERNQWDGMTGVDDKGFIIFSSIEYGYRAATKILLSYARRGVVTLKDIVSTWAPESENETDIYVSNVSGWLGVDSNDQVGVDMYPALIAAMERMEVGRYPLDIAAIDRGVSMAYV